MSSTFSGQLLIIGLAAAMRKDMSIDTLGVASCDAHCQGAGFSRGIVDGTAPFCRGDCSTCSGQCSKASKKWSDYGSGCVSGKKMCCCEQPKSSCSDFCVSRGYGPGVMVGTAPLCGASCESNCNAKAGYCMRASSRLFTDYGSKCAKGNKICCCKHKPLLGGKLPDGTQVSPLSGDNEFTIHEKTKWIDELNARNLDIHMDLGLGVGITGIGTDSNEYIWTMRTAHGEKAILFAKGKRMSNTFGHQSVYVTDKSGTELFKIRRSNYGLNPFQWHKSFRILPPGSKDNKDALFTINSGVETGFLGAEQQHGIAGSATKYAAWRIYRGRERDGEMIYYCLGSFTGWSFRCYPNQKSYQDSGITGTDNTVATVSQHLNWGAVLEHASAADAFSMSVRKGEDALVLLAWISIVDMTRDSAGGAEGIGGLHSLS